MAANGEAETLISERSRKRKRDSHIPKLLPDQKVEVRSVEEGFQGSWHGGIVIKQKNQICVVKYDHILCDDGFDSLIESIPVLFALEDKISANRGPKLPNFRGKIRPVPPDLILNDKCLHYGQCVDVFHEEAWWEGVIFDHGYGSEERSVFFPDIGDELKVPVINLRLTQDWDAATDHWNIRGDWIFLEVIEELELEWPLLVSLKQIWYEVRMNKRFSEEILEWMCPLRKIWKETVKEVIIDNFKLTMVEFFSRLNSSGDLQLESEIDECFLDYMANLEPSFFESLGVVPCDPSPLAVEEEFDDDDLGPPGFSNLPSSSDNVFSIIKSKYEFISTRSKNPCCEPSTTDDYYVAGPDLVPQAEFCPDAIFEYYKSFSSGHKPPVTLAPKVRQHLSCLGWKIEVKRTKKEGTPSFRYRYTDPTGKQYYSLNVICTELSNCSSEITSFGSYDAQIYPEDLVSLTPTKEEQETWEQTVVESEFCPQALLDYYSTVEKYSDLRSMRKYSKFRELQSRTKKHLFAVGWSEFHVEDMSGRKKLVYSSPSGRKFYSLGQACSHYILQSFGCGLEEDVEGALTIAGKSQNEGVKSDQNQMVGKLKIKKKNGVLCIETASSLPSTNQVVKKDEPLMKSRNEDSSTTTRASRSSKRVREKVSPMHQNPRTILSWLIDNNVVLPRSKVHYRCRKDGDTMREGRVTGDGIKCSCCQSTFGLSKFESHAGSTYRQPSSNIFLEDGRSLLDCQLQLKRDQHARFSRTESRRLKGNRHQSENDNDYVCSVCHYGGELVLCDQCPASFHTHCLGLQEVPDGDWFCPSCCCRICNQHRFSESCEHSLDSNTLVCEQCERRYHIGCFKRREGLSNLERCPEINWFCSHRCEEIHMGLNRLLGKPIPMGRDNLTWTLLKHEKSECSNNDASNMDESTEIYSKLNVAIGVMHECFEPVKEPRTRRDLVEDVILCRWSELNRLNFKGFYTVLLEKDNDELITAATIRVYGDKVAEIPLVGTRFQYRRRGMCHLLMNELEKILTELGVERLVLPAVPSVLHTWTTSFGFSVMTESEKLEFLGYTFLDFQGTKMCHKLLPRGLPSTNSTISRGKICDAIDKSDIMDLDCISAPFSEVSQAERIEDRGILEQSSSEIARENDDNGSGTAPIDIMANQPTHIESQSQTSIGCSMKASSTSEDENHNGNKGLLICYHRRKNRCL